MRKVVGEDGKGKQIRNQGPCVLREKYIRDSGGHKVKMCGKERWKRKKPTLNLQTEGVGSDPSSVIIRHLTLRKTLLLFGIQVPNW